MAKSKKKKSDEEFEAELKDEWPSYVTALESYPEHVRAIGSISIEIANLDDAFSGLLGALLNRRIEIAAAIYFSPQSYGPRLAIIRNVVQVLFPEDDNPMRKDLLKYVEKAREHVEKRNTLVHSAWLVRPQTKEVFYSSHPALENKAKLARVVDLKHDLDRIRKLHWKVRTTTDAVHQILWERQRASDKKSD